MLEVEISGMLTNTGVETGFTNLFDQFFELVCVLSAGTERLFSVQASSTIFAPRSSSSPRSSV